MIKTEELAHYTGSEHFYLYGGKLVVTDGVRYLIDNGCAWLIDIIASVRGLPSIKTEEKEFWTLKVDLDAHTAVITADVPPGNVTI